MPYCSRNARTVIHPRRPPPRNRTRHHRYAKQHHHRSRIRPSNGCTPNSNVSVSFAATAAAPIRSPGPLPPALPPAAARPPGSSQAALLVPPDPDLSRPLRSQRPVNRLCQRPHQIHRAPRLQFPQFAPAPPVPSDPGPLASAPGSPSPASKQVSASRGQSALWQLCCQPLPVSGQGNAVGRILSVETTRTRGGAVKTTRALNREFLHCSAAFD
jgi:hypothetical protein